MPTRESAPVNSPVNAVHWKVGGIVAALVALIAVAYWRVGQCDFVNLDDDAYVYAQPMVNQGVRPAAIVWAFSAAHSGLWHPVTTLTHILDCQLFGLRAGPMHWENLVWHVLNAVLVFVVWRALTGAFWRPAIVAMLFALHPLDVESVAWISERKNLVSTFFWLLGLAAYARYARAPTAVRYLWVAALMTLALLSKPMPVTFPAVLLLLDYWPLARWPERSWKQLLVEKLPLMGLSIVHSVVTFLSQHRAEADKLGAHLTVDARVANAVVSYTRYLGKAVWPDSLSVFYSHPGGWPAPIVIGAALPVAALLWLTFVQRKQRPWLIVGWLWFLGVLVPVIGLVQVGAQSIADRYTYVPLLGVYVALVWCAAEFTARSRVLRVSLLTALAIVLAALVVLTNRRVTAWTDSIRLYERCIAAGEDNATLRYLLATAYASARRPVDEVVAQFRRALQLDPAYTNALTQLAFIDLQMGRFAEAEASLRRVVLLEPRNPATHLSLGAFLMHRSRMDEAAQELREAVRLKPNYAEAHRGLATIALGVNHREEAREHLTLAVGADPWNPDTLCDLGVLCGMLRHVDEARRHLERALWLRPQFPRAHENLEALQRPPPFSDTRR